jgi:hypothetical protein
VIRASASSAAQSDTKPPAMPHATIHSSTQKLPAPVHLFVASLLQGPRTWSAVRGKQCACECTWGRARSTATFPSRCAAPCVCMPPGLGSPQCASCALFARFSDARRRLSS